VLSEGAGLKELLELLYGEALTVPETEGRAEADTVKGRLASAEEELLSTKDLLLEMLAAPEAEAEASPELQEDRVAEGKLELDAESA